MEILGTSIWAACVVLFLCIVIVQFLLIFGRLRPTQLAPLHFGIVGAPLVLTLIGSYLAFYPLERLYAEGKKGDFVVDKEGHRLDASRFRAQRNLYLSLFAVISLVVTWFLVRLLRERERLQLMYAQAVRQLTALGQTVQEPAAAGAAQHAHAQ